MFRDLKFSTLEEIETELQKMKVAKKINTSGVWSSYQIIKHISEMLEYSMTSYPVEAPKIVQFFAGFVKTLIFLQGKMFRGLPNPLAPSKREEGDFEFELKLYLERLNSLKNFTGKFAPHPMFGELPKKEWIKLHSIHAALHLSYINYE